MALGPEVVQTSLIIRHKKVGLTMALGPRVVQQSLIIRHQKVGLTMAPGPGVVPESSIIRHQKVGLTRTASLLLGFGDVWVDVKMLLWLWVRRAAACVMGGSFRASHREILLCLWVRRAADCVVRGSFRATYRLGRRISDCVVASRVWGCVGEC